MTPRLALLSLALAATACSERDAPLGSPCDERAEKPAIGGALTLELHRGEGVREQELRAVVAAVAAYFAEFELEVAAAPTTLELPYEAMLAASASPLSDQAAGNERDDLARLREFARAHAAEQDGAVRVVALRSIAEPTSTLASQLGALHGLAFSPAMPPSASGAPELGELVAELKAPVILLAPRGDLYADARVLAHEIGHALGLEHRHHPHNLMTQHEHGCAPSLDRAQAEAMRRALGELKAR